MIKNGKMHRPGIEPGASRNCVIPEDITWQRLILPLNHRCGCYLKIKRLSNNILLLIQGALRRKLSNRYMHDGDCGHHGVHVGLWSIAARNAETLTIFI
jgi:hypothetical protein